MFDYVSSLRALSPKNDAMSTKSGLGQVIDSDVNKQVTFMTEMLLTQIKNQYPGNETNADDMVRTIMGMMNTTQHVKTNKLLEDNLAFSRHLFGASMTSYEGDYVEHDGDLFEFEKNGLQKFTYKLPSDAYESFAHILDASGNIVKSYNLKDTEGQIIWTGEQNDTNPAPTGTYQLIIQTQNEDGKPLHGQKWLQSLVTGVEYDDNQIPLLISGALPIGKIKGHKKAFWPTYALPPETSKISTSA